MSESAQHFIEYELQIIALVWMGALYAIKAIQLSRLPMPWERAPREGSPARGAMRSYAAIFLPWSRESTRQHPWRWAEFSAYHVGAFVAIINTFTMPFAPGFMTDRVRLVFALAIAPAFVIGFVKFIRRASRPELRMISTPDDYFSVATLQLFFGTAVMALIADTVFWNMSYFIVTAAFLFYVPFSKISHYVYYFFAHALTGSRYGYRGIVPSERRAA